MTGAIVRVVVARRTCALLMCPIYTWSVILPFTMVELNIDIHGHLEDVGRWCKEELECCAL